MKESSRRKLLDRMLDAALKERFSRLTRKYDPDLVFDVWTMEVKAGKYNFPAIDWDPQMTLDQLLDFLDDHYKLIESLIQKRQSEETEGKLTEMKPRFGIVNLEKRRNPRFSLDLPVEYYRISSPISHPGRTGNVSEGGLMVYLPERLDIGQYLKLKLFLDLEIDPNPVEMLVRVVWTDIHWGEEGDYRSGVRFAEISQEDWNRLRNFLQNLSEMKMPSFRKEKEGS